MIGAFVAVLLAVFVWWLCREAGLPVVIAAIAAVLVLLAGVGSGFGDRFHWPRR